MNILVRVHTSKDSKHEQENGKDKSHWSPQNVLMEYGRDDYCWEKGQLVVGTAVKELEESRRGQRSYSVVKCLGNITALGSW